MRFQRNFILLICALIWQSLGGYCPGGDAAFYAADQDDDLTQIWVDFIRKAREERQRQPVPSIEEKTVEPAVAEPIATKTAPASFVGQLDVCEDELLGVSLLCSSRWPVTGDTDTLYFVISPFKPAVTMTVIKMNPHVEFLYELSRDRLQSLGEYQSGFDVEEVHLSGFNAFKVKAFSLTHPQIRLLDYYVVYDGALYGLWFSIDPKEDWDRYQFLFQTVADSFRFN